MIGKFRCGLKLVVETLAVVESVVTGSTAINLVS